MTPFGIIYLSALLALIVGLGREARNWEKINTMRNRK